VAEKVTVISALFQPPVPFLNPARCLFKRRVLIKNQRGAGGPENGIAFPGFYSIDADPYEKAPLDNGAYLN
jgi:hypothetical protein